MSTAKVVSTFFAKPVSPPLIARPFIAQPDGKPVEGAEDQLEQYVHRLWIVVDNQRCLSIEIEIVPVPISTWVCLEDLDKLFY
jgi:hypothetical protein